MAIICRDYHLLFIQAPRTGCTAIAGLLKERFGGEQLPADDIMNSDGFFDVPRKHCSIHQLLAKQLIPADYVSTMVTFTSVRNPYDSLASLYVKKRDKYRAMLEDKTSFVYKVPGYVEDMEFCRTHSFEEWIEKHYPVRWFDRLLGRGRKSLSDRYTRGVQRVMRFESLQQDFESVMRGVGIQGDVTIPHVNATPRRKASYQSYYTEQARRTVEYVFQPELAKYGYSFEGVEFPPARPLMEPSR